MKALSRSLRDLLLGLLLSLVPAVATAQLDAVFANRNQVNRVCLGDGTGSLNNCNNVSADTNDSRGVALGLVLDPVIFVDGFESGDTSAWSATVP